MRIELAHITPRRQRLKSAPTQKLLQDYLERASHLCPAQAVAYPSESALFAAFDKAAARSPSTLILLDSHGDALTSEEIAVRLGKLRDSGAQQLTFAIGPSDGWSAAALPRATLRLSLGRITLPHELALAILAEQIYRALSILAGHPYHSAHR